MRGDREAEVEDRLERADRRQEELARATQSSRTSLLAAMQSRRHRRRREVFISRYLNLRLLFEQADVHYAGAALPVDLRRPGRRRRLSCPTLAGFNVVLGPADRPVPRVPAAHVAAVAPQAPPQKIRRPIARRPRADRPRPARRPQPRGRLQPRCRGNVRPDRRRIQPHVRRTKPRHPAGGSARTT